MHNNIPIEIPSHPNVLLNRTVLCNCIIEAENNFLLESIAACDLASTDVDTYACRMEQPLKNFRIHFFTLFWLF